MKSDKSEIMKYLGAATAVGGTILLGSGLMKESKSMKKKMRKTANKALDAVDSVINGVQNIVK